MLNEVWRLCQALKRSKTEPARKHKRVYQPGRKSPCLRVSLGVQGEVVSIFDVTEEEWPSLWTVMEGNQNSFPVVRIQKPLLNIDRTHEAWSKLGYDERGNRHRPPDDQSRLACLEDLAKNIPIRSLEKKEIRKLWERLINRKAAELVECSKGHDQMRVVQLLGERFQRVERNPAVFIENIVRRALERGRQGRLKSIDAVEQLLVGKGPPDDKGKIPPVTVQIAFDIENNISQIPPLYSEQILKLIIEHLPQTPSWEKKSGQTGIDALSGEHAELEEKNFPKVDLPVPSSRPGNRIGRKRFPISSMFSAARCNRRYGMTDAQVFPLARTRAMQLKEALEEITADDRREKTWQHVASGRFDNHNGRKLEKMDLLIAYVDEKPKLDEKIARYFGQGSSIMAAKFEEDAAAVCAALRGIVREKSHSRLNLFLIREVSRGQSQVVLAESPPVARVLEAAERWQKAVRDNVPEVRMDLPLQTIKGQRFPAVPGAKPLAPYPDQVVRLLSHQWVRDGSSAKPKGGGKPQEPRHEVIGPGLGDVLALMLRMEGKWESAAKHMLDLLIRQTAPLLIGVFGAQHAYGPRKEQGKPEPIDDYPRSSRATALQAVAVFGILLDAFELRKENYMENAPFQVGQVLALADTLHKDYCVVVRKGQLPNSLIGTSLMRRALDSPAGALADLSERIIEYVRWAKTAQIVDSWSQNEKIAGAVNEARKKLRQYESLADKLGKCELPRETDDIMKAQLLLGFLASQPDED